MTLSSALDDSAPVNSVGEARERVRELVGTAIRRQLWLMLLDASGRQLSLLIPVGGIPLRPEPGSVAPIAARLNDILSAEAPGGSAILTLERPGTAALTAPDQAWARELETTFGKVMRITGMFVAHDDGVCRLRG
ncbi:MAG: hypothetical protein ABIX44_09790 [Cryobacterium sp.]